jgi:hypothetical protein
VTSFESHLVSGLALGALSGALGGFVSGIALLQLNRFRNRLAAKRGEPLAKNLVRPSFHVPGALAGAIAGAVTSQRGDWVSIVCGFTAFPAILCVLVVGSLIVERGQRKS